MCHHHYNLAVGYSYIYIVCCGDVFLLSFEASLCVSCTRQSSCRHSSIQADVGLAGLLHFVKLSEKYNELSERRECKNVISLQKKSQSFVALGHYYILALQK